MSTTTYEVFTDTTAGKERIGWIDVVSPKSGPEVIRLNHELASLVGSSKDLGFLIVSAQQMEAHGKTSFTFERECKPSSHYYLSQFSRTEE